MDILQREGYGVTIKLVEGEDHSVALCMDAEGEVVLAMDKDLQHNRNYGQNLMRSEALCAKMEEELSKKS